MPKKIPLIEMRKWLRQYEEGKSVATIAKSVRHDIRTVARGIEQARHEKLAGAARGEMLKEALQKHQDDLTEVIKSLQSAVVIPQPIVMLPVRRSTLQRVTLKEAIGEYGESGWTITLAIDGTMKLALFQEHMRRDPIWKILNEWKSAVADYLLVSWALRQKVIKLLREVTGLELIESIEGAGDRYLYPAGVDLIYGHIVNFSLGIQGQAIDQKQLLSEEPYLHYGRERIPILIAPGAVDEYRRKVLTAVAELEKSATTRDIVTSYRRVEEITGKAGKALEELSLLRLVPGQCRVCRRLLGS